MEEKPSVLMLDGNGILHPRGIGIASHVGVLFDIPTIGVAKSLLCGEVRKDDLVKKGWAEIVYNGKPQGIAFNSSGSAKQIYISPGHKLSLKTAFKIVRHLTDYRIPEPTRQAHILANELRKNV
jgi:deoxyribonuclease V